MFLYCLLAGRSVGSAFGCNYFCYYIYYCFGSYCIPYSAGMSAGLHIRGFPPAWGHFLYGRFPVCFAYGTGLGSFRRAMTLPRPNSLLLY